MKIVDSIWSMFTNDIGIDLGTANTMVTVEGKGIIIKEPSVVALNRKTKQVLAVGEEARRMIGRTPSSIIAVRPLSDGVISDFDTTEAMIRYFIQKAHNEDRKAFKIPRPRVVIGIPSVVTEVEARAVIDAAHSAGARKAYVIEEPMAAAIGAGLPIDEAAGSMIVDIGGGTTNVAVISLGGIVVDKTIRIAGDEMDEEIVNFARHKYNLFIGVRTAEDIKISVGSAEPLKKERDFDMKGRDLVTGLPKNIKVSSVEIREVLMRPLGQIVDAIKDAIEATPPELLSDLLERGITLAGGVALLSGIDKFLAKQLKTPVNIADDPISCVVRGTGKVVKDIELLSKVQVVGEDLL
ncbi:MAG: rod shape-determining protein [Candidatus Dojkabacteria bacterium]|nr:rod shape-determining protein [Candidatus Dojkabacteria bacterium]